jgi:eukaryotic-like serine/threonine-protein kinase
LEKEPSRRYLSVEQFGDDIRRHLDGHPVFARPATWRYRSSRFVRRHQKAVAAAAAVAVVIVALGTALVLYAARATRERNTAQRMTSLLVELFSNAGQSGQGASMTVSELLDRGTERVKRELTAQPDLQAQLLDAIGSIYVDLGLLDRAQDALRGSMAARSTAGALDSMAAARTMFLLADSLRQRGQHAAAEPLARSAVEMGSRLVGFRNPQVAQWAITLGQILHATGKNAEAEALLVETTQIFRETLGPEHPMVALALSSTAAIRKDVGDLRGAEQLARDALAIVTRVFGQATADRFAQVAEIVQASGRADEAEVLLRDAVEQRRRAVGAVDHPSLAPALEQLAAQLRANGKALEAEALENEARILKVR